MTSGVLPGLLEWASATRPFPGQGVSGDDRVVAPFEGGALLGAIDGLGHGPEAAHAARTGHEALVSRPGDDLRECFKRCHERLRPTRGAALSLATVSTHDRRLAWAGVGNVEALLLRANPACTPPREWLAPMGGVVGSNLPALRPQLLSLEPDDLLVFATDGVDPRFGLALRTHMPPGVVADQILARFGRDDDDALVLAVRILREA